MEKAEEILAAVAKATGVCEVDILSHRHNRAYCRARRVFWLAMRMYGVSTELVGRISGHDHSTVGKMTLWASEGEKFVAEEVLKTMGIKYGKMSQKAVKGKKTRSPRISLLGRQVAKVVRERKVPDYRSGDVKVVKEVVYE